MLKTVFKILVLLGTLAYFVYAMVVINKPSHELYCRGLDISVKDVHHTHFFTSNDVKAYLVSKRIFLEGQSIDSINLNRLEKVLLQNPYIDEVLCYKTINDKVVVDIVPREPVVHVLSNSGQDYYIDNKGTLIPRGHHAIDLVVLTGDVDSATIGQRYTSLGLYIINDEFWNQQIEEIHVTPSGLIELTPRVGNHTILLGDTSMLDNKMRRLRAFYERGLNKMGWNRYKTINLQFENQVVCVYADSIKP